MSAQRCGGNRYESPARGHVPGKPGNVAHGKIEPSKSAEKTGEQERIEPGPVHIDAHRPGGIRVLAYRPDSQAQGGLIDNYIVEEDGQDRAVGKNIMAAQDFPQHRNGPDERDMDFRKHQAGQGAGSPLIAGKDEEQENGHSGGEQVQCNGGQNDIGLQFQVEITEQGGQAGARGQAGQKSEQKASGEGAYHDAGKGRNQHDPFLGYVNRADQLRDSHADSREEEGSHHPEDGKAELRGENTLKKRTHAGPPLFQLPGW